MKNKNFALLSFFLIIISIGSVFAQEKWNAYPIDTTKFEIKETSYTYPLIEKGLDEELIFIVNKEKILYTVSIPNKPSITLIEKINTKAYEKIIGHWYDKKNIYLLFSSKSRERFLKLSISRKDYTLISGEVTMLPIEEKVFASTLTNNQLNLFTIEENSNTIRIRQIEEYSFKLIKEFNLANEFKLGKILLSDLITMEGENTVLIDPSLPTPLVIAGKLNKMYVGSDLVRFTFNGSPEKGTFILTINLKNYTYTLQSIALSNEVPLIGIKVNSFIYSDTLVQLETNTLRSAILFYKLSTGTFINKYVLKKGEKIPFKNADNITNLTNNNTIETVEIKRTEKLLRNFQTPTNSIAVSIYNDNGNSILWIGAYHNQDYYKAKAAPKETSNESTTSGGGNGSGGGKGSGGGGKSGNKKEINKTENNGSKGNGSGSGEGKGTGNGLNKTKENSAELNNSVLYRNLLYINNGKPTYYIGIQNPSTLEHLPKATFDNVLLESIKNFEKNSIGSTNTLANTLFKTKNNKFIYGYFDKKSSNYLLMKF